MSHLCHAIGCYAPIPPKLLMCMHHWRLVPRDLQDAVWEYYRPGQEITKDPSPEYLLAAFRARLEVAVIEGRIARHNALEQMARRHRQMEARLSREQ